VNKNIVHRKQNIHIMKKMVVIIHFRLGYANVMIIKYCKKIFVLSVVVTIIPMANLQLKIGVNVNK
jgi:hypothetical protein